ncbi:unnamed protein product [Polarella glacialis]|uniref:UDENN domain-containing protein n=1 Tax=Polarella glacialis TaxID=89957 RepID=A0A813G9C3_POLGL|nr:unnamed protein product [Polarella glacialis]
MFKKLQRFVPKDVKEALQQAQAAISGSGAASNSAVRRADGEAPASASLEVATGGDDDDIFGISAYMREPPVEIFEIGEDDDLAPLFEPLAEEEVALFQALEKHAGDGLTTEAAADAGASGRRETSSLQRVSGSTVRAPSPGIVFERNLEGCGPVAAILLIDFHHARGPVVEWAHPPSAMPSDGPSSPCRPSSLEDEDAFPTLDPWVPGGLIAEASAAVLRAMPLVASLALPDAAHNEREGKTSSVFFVVPCGNGQILYGVSCHRRVGVADLLHRDASVSRSSVQKAVCVLSRCPFFGLIQQRLSPVTQVFFEQRDFRCTALLSDFQAQLDAVPFEKLPESELFHGLDHSHLFFSLRYQLLAVLKAILLEAKVMVYSPSAEAASSAVLCLLSLLPGALWLSFNSDGLGSRHFQFRKHGLPIQCFGPRCCVYPYLGLQMLDRLLQMRGFLVGTTNKMLAERTCPDILIEVPASMEQNVRGVNECTVHFHSKELKELLKCSSAETDWLKEALAKLEAATPVQQTASASSKVVSRTVPASSPAERSSPVSANAVEEDEELVADDSCTDKSASPGATTLDASPSHSEEMVPDTVANVASRRPPEAGSLLQEACRAGVVDADRNAFYAYWTRLLSATAKAAGPERDFARGLEVATRQEKAELARFGLGFLQRWTSRTQGGKTWLQAHRLPVTERRAKPPRDGSGTYRFANGDEYHGEFRRGVRHGAGVYVSKRSRMQYDGQWFRDRRCGSGTLIIEGNSKVSYTYDGQWLADMRHGVGSCVRSHKEKYSGQWAQNLYHGAGSFVNEQGVLYEGEWREGKFHGVGKHVYRGETYTGHFVDGERHGMGQLVRAAAPAGRGAADGSAPAKPAELARASSDADSSVEDSVLGTESLYAGFWRAGRRQGHGTAIYALGEYEGDWVLGQRDGHGVLSHKGYQLDGPWVSNMPDELGTHMIFYPDGAKYTGRIRCRVSSSGEDAAAHQPSISSSSSAGKVGKDGSADCPDSVLTAEAHTRFDLPAPTPWNIVPDGSGIMKLPDGRLYEGQYQAGAPHGRGLAIDPERGKYEGEFSLGERHGSGLLEAPGDENSTPVHYQHGRVFFPPSRTLSAGDTSSPTNAACASAETAIPYEADHKDHQPEPQDAHKQQAPQGRLSQQDQQEPLQEQKQDQQQEDQREHQQQQNEPQQQQGVERQDQQEMDQQQQEQKQEQQEQQKQQQQALERRDQQEIDSVGEAPALQGASGREADHRQLAVNDNDNNNANNTTNNNNSSATEFDDGRAAAVSTELEVQQNSPKAALDPQVVLPH